MHFSVLTALFAVALLSGTGVSMDVPEHDVVQARVRRQNSLEVDGADSGNAGRGPQSVSFGNKGIRLQNSLPLPQSASPSSSDSMEMMEELVYGLPGLVSKKLVVRSRANRGGVALPLQSAETFSDEQQSGIRGAVPVSTENA